MPQKIKITQGKAYKFYDIGADTLIIWFGGRDEPFISDKMVEATGCDMLSVINAKADWYLGGIHGVGKNLEDGIKFLREYASRERYKYVFICGQSSGGYMALRVSHILKPTAALVFNPNTQNFPLNSPIFSPHKYPQRWQIVNLNELYTKEPVSFPITYNVGRSEDDHTKKWRCDDLEHAKVFKKMDNVTYVQQPYDTHILTAAMRKKNQFYACVKSWVVFQKAVAEANAEADK